MKVVNFLGLVINFVGLGMNVNVFLTKVNIEDLFG